MANQEQLGILKEGIEVWNKWRNEHPDLTIDLSKADLEDADLGGIDFGGRFLFLYHTDDQISEVKPTRSLANIVEDIV